jgi:hypothetical protein
VSDPLDELLRAAGIPVDGDDDIPAPTGRDMVRAGRFNDDGSYSNDDQEVISEQQSPWQQMYPNIMPCDPELYVQQLNARSALAQHGFTIIEDGGTTMFEAMGGKVVDNPLNVRHLGF